MRYVQRDRDGLVISHFANEQSYATELVADDHPDLLAYRAAREAVRAQARLDAIAIRTLVARVAELERKTALMP